MESFFYFQKPYAYVIMVIVKYAHWEAENHVRARGKPSELLTWP